MIGMKVEEMERDAARLEARRNRAAGRNTRLLDAKARTMGMDMEALNSQVTEKQLNKERAKQEELEHASRLDHIDRIIEEQEQEMARIRRQEKEGLKKTWQQQMSAPKNQPPKIADGVSPENCSLGALQAFHGEDRMKEKRQQMQTNQFRSWTTQQMAEKQMREWEEKEEDKRYANYILSQTERRSSMECGEEDERRRAALQLRADNEMLAKQQAEARRLEKERDMQLAKMELKKNMENPFLCENVPAAGMPIQREHFKGFSKNQTQQIYKENEHVLDSKLAQANYEKEKNQIDHERTTALLGMVEHEETMRRREIQEEAQRHRNTLLEQREIEQKRKEESKLDSYGSVNQKFFGNFGTSCR